MSRGEEGKRVYSQSGKGSLETGKIRGIVMGWNTICLEAFCLGESVADKYPCGRGCPDYGCLARGKCPCLGYAATTEREVACFVPAYQLVWDRLWTWVERGWCCTRWHLWDRWFYRPLAFLNEMGEVEEVECPEYDDRSRTLKVEFDAWYKGEGGIK